MRLARIKVWESISDGVADLCKENQKRKEMVANLILSYTIVKKLGQAGLSENYRYRKYMRLLVLEKEEIILLVKRSKFGVNRT